MVMLRHGIAGGMVLNGGTGNARPMFHTPRTGRMARCLLATAAGHFGLVAPERGKQFVTCSRGKTYRTCHKN